MSEQVIAAMNVGSMHVEQEVTIEASPERVFAALTNELSAWWGAPYLGSDAARALILEPKIGGRFYIRDVVRRVLPRHERSDELSRP